jgi:hypothetical protein
MKVTVKTKIDRKSVAAPLASAKMPAVRKLPICNGKNYRWVQKIAVWRSAPPIRL